MFNRIINNIFCYNLSNRDMLGEVIVKIGLERIDIQKEVIVECYESRLKVLSQETTLILE